ncbi:hypothetical protein GYA13_00920 [Candidatus Kuenenbacteria bacterium]|nr:hypothetical protein [Candidatus Kuenenbacteria bacterium]
MKNYSLPLTKLIHENISIVMTFAFSQKPLENLLNTNFVGEWKYLRELLFEISELRANKACLELAMFIRILDDEKNISNYFEKTNHPNFGRLIQSDKTEKELSIRDLANKIIHASKLTWDFSAKNKPILICESRDEKWIKAKIDLVSLAAFGGEIMS